MNRLRQRGAGNVGCLLGLVLFAVAVVIAIKVIPIKVAVSEFKDFTVKEAEQASLPRHTDEVIIAAMLQKAQQLKLPVGKEQIQIRRDQAMIYIEYKFRIILNLTLTKYNWDVSEKVERNLF